MRPSEASHVPAAKVPRLIAEGGLSAEEYIGSILSSARRIDPKIHSYLHLAEERAMSAAAMVDAKVKRHEKLGRLSGLAIAVKDNICVRSMQATCASKILQGFLAPYDATVIERMVAEDAIIVGKTNMDEFAMGNTTQSSAYGPTFNPWDMGRVPGGSSGGSAAAVAAGIASLALGSDTGGSVRCPASFCSVSGLKPTYGRVSRYGLIPYANSLEQIGPVGLTAADVALLLEVIAGEDSRDSTSSPELVAKPKDRRDLKGVRVGVVKEFFGEGTDEKVTKAVLAASEKIQELGARVDEVSLTTLPYSLAAYYIIAMAEASSNLSRYDGVRYGASLERGPSDWNTAFAKTRSECFGDEVKRRIMMGSFVLSAGYYEAYYVRAQKVRTLLMREFERAFKRFDLLLGPTMPVVPPRVGERLSPLEDYIMDINTVSANLTGLPAMSIPCGMVGDLPVGLQLIAPMFREDVLLSVADLFQRNSDHHLARPPVGAS